MSSSTRVSTLKQRQSRLTRSKYEKVPLKADIASMMAFIKG